jgi:hypothetical protein
MYEVNDVFMDNLQTVLKDFSGNTPVQIVIKDDTSGYNVELATELGVNVCSELQDYLDSASFKYRFLKN